MAAILFCKWLDTCFCWAVTSLLECSIRDTYEWLKPLLRYLSERRYPDPELALCCEGEAFE